MRAQGISEKAFTVYKESIKKFPYDVHAYKGEAELLIEQGRIEEAISVYKNAIKRIPNDKQTQNSLAVLLKDMPT